MDGFYDNITNQQDIINANYFIRNKIFSDYKISVVIPAYNEEESIGHVINDYKSNNNVNEILVIDNNSNDNTSSIALKSGARVIQATVKEELPEGFQKSEYVQKTGFIDLIVERKDLREKIGSILSILLKKNSDIISISDETSEDNRTLTKAAS